MVLITNGTRAMKRAFTFIILAGLVTMLVGCEEPLNWDRIKGRQVQFEVSSRSDVKTKTSYSDAFYTEGGRNFERINWVTGDQIRIYSSNTAKVSSNIGDYYDYYDYSIASVTPNDRRSDAKLTQPAAGEGLIWVDDPYDVTFYGTYPPMNPRRNESNELIAFVDMSIPATQGPTWSGRVGTPNMSYAYMVSAPATFQGTDVDGQTVPKMHMDFYPLFNAFYFVLASQDNEIQLNSLTLSANKTSDYLSGRFNYTISTLTSAGPTVGGVSHVGDNGTSVSVNFPSGTTISKTDSVKVTLLTLPPQIGSAISGLTLTVNYGDNKVASLPLKYSNGNPLQFPAFHKARITGLAMKGGSNWQLTIDDQVLPWIEDEQTTSFKSNIGITNQKFSGYVVTNPLYIYEDVNNNILRQTTPYYDGQAVSPDDYYYLNNGKYTKNGYYIRLTTKIEGEDDPCITYQFTPTMPIGGYWQLSPEAVEGSLDYFRITVDDGINGESTRLQGQVMGVPVTIYIRPTAEYLALDNAPVCSCIIKCNMSPSANWDPLYSADSEFQSAHTDGTFSYNKFRIAK